MANRRLEDMGDIFTEEGRSKLKKGQVLVFDFEGSEASYKVMKIDGEHVWVKRVTLFTEDQVNIVDKK